jgi:hypothetical protein
VETAAFVKILSASPAAGKSNSHTIDTIFLTDDFWVQGARLFIGIVVAGHFPLVSRDRQYTS